MTRFRALFARWPVFTPPTRPLSGAEVARIVRHGWR